MPPAREHPQRGFLFPVKALSKVFRGKFAAALRSQRQKGTPEGAAALYESGSLRPRPPEAGLPTTPGHPILPTRPHAKRLAPAIARLQSP